MGDTTTFGPGTLAYIDSFGGLVPCKVLSIDARRIKVRITATRGAYQRRSIEVCPHRAVVPRGHVQRRKHRTTIVGGYVWEVSP